MWGKLNTIEKANTKEMKNYGKADGNTIHYSINKRTVDKCFQIPGGGELPYMAYIGMCGPKG